MFNYNLDDYNNFYTEVNKKWKNAETGGEFIRGLFESDSRMPYIYRDLDTNKIQIRDYNSLPEGKEKLPFIDGRRKLSKQLNGPNAANIRNEIIDLYKKNNYNTSINIPDAFNSDVWKHFEKFTKDGGVLSDDIGIYKAFNATDKAESANKILNLIDENKLSNILNSDAPESLKTNAIIEDVFKNDQSISLDEFNNFFKDELGFSGTTSSDMFDSIRNKYINSENNKPDNIIDDTIQYNLNNNNDSSIENQEEINNNNNVDNVVDETIEQQQTINDNEEIADEILNNEDSTVSIEEDDIKFSDTNDKSPYYENKQDIWDETESKKKLEDAYNQKNVFEDEDTRKAKQNLDSHINNDENPYYENEGDIWDQTRSKEKLDYAEEYGRSIVEDEEAVKKLDEHVNKRKNKPEPEQVVTPETTPPIPDENIIRKNIIKNNDEYKIVESWNNEFKELSYMNKQNGSSSYIHYDKTQKKATYRETGDHLFEGKMSFDITDEIYKFNNGKTSIGYKHNIDADKVKFGIVDDNDIDNYLVDFRDVTRQKDKTLRREHEDNLLDAMYEKEIEQYELGKRDIIEYVNNDGDTVKTKVRKTDKNNNMYELDTDYRDVLGDLPDGSKKYKRKLKIGDKEIETTDGFLDYTNGTYHGSYQKDGATIKTVFDEDMNPLSSVWEKDNYKLDYKDEIVKELTDNEYALLKMKDLSPIKDGVPDDIYKQRQEYINSLKWDKRFKQTKEKLKDKFSWKKEDTNNPNQPTPDGGNPPDGSNKPDTKTDNSKPTKPEKDSPYYQNDGDIWDPEPGKEKLEYAEKYGTVPEKFDEIQYSAFKRERELRLKEEHTKYENLYKDSMKERMDLEDVIKKVKDGDQTVIKDYTDKYNKLREKERNRKRPNNKKYNPETKNIDNVDELIDVLQKDYTLLKNKETLFKDKKRKALMDYNNRNTPEKVLDEIANLDKLIKDTTDNVNKHFSDDMLEDIEKWTKEKTYTEQLYKDKLKARDGISSTTTSKKSLGKMANIAINTVSTIGTYKDKRREGHSVLSSAATAGVTFAMGELLGPVGFVAVSLASEIPTAVVKGSNALFTEMRRMNSASRVSTFGEAEFNDSQQLATMRQSGMELAKMSQYRLEQTLMGNEAKYLHR